MFFKIFIYTLKRQIRDKEAMLMLLLFPIVLILILGTALSGVFGPSDIGRIRTQYMNEDNGQMRTYLDGFIFSEGIGEYLEIGTAAVKEEGMKSVSEGEAAAFIYIGEDYSEKSLSGEKGDIDIYMQASSQVRQAVIESMFDSFSNVTNTMSAIRAGGFEAEEFHMTEAAIRIPVSKDGRIPGAMDYYAVTMLVMTLMYGTLYGGIGMVEMFHENLGKRLHTTPANRFVFYSASVLGFVVTIFLQGTVIVFFTRYVYGVYWGSNIVTVLLIILAMCFFSISLGTFTGMAARDRRVTVAVLQIMIPITTFISGGYFKFQIPDPAVKDLISAVVPNAMAQTALFNTIYGGPASKTGMMLLIIISAGVVLITASVLAGRRKFA